MRFNIPFKRQGIFFEILTKEDLRYFDNAFKAHKPDNKFDKRLPKDREWVDDIMTAWAEKMEIPKSLAVQMFLSANYHAAQMHYRKVKKPALEAEINSIRQSKGDDHTKAFLMDAVLKQQKDVELVCKWDDADLANWCRSTFGDALGITHPNWRFDAHAKRTKEKRVKTVNPMDANKPHVARVRPKSKDKRKGDFGHQNPIAT